MIGRQPGEPDSPPAAGAADSVPAPSARPRRKNRRVIAQPQSLQVRTELTGTYDRLPGVSSVEQALARRDEAGTTGSTAAHARPADPLGGLRAKDEDPAGWGERPEDLTEQIRREKPPHWG